MRGRQVDFCQHAASTAAADSFDVVNVYHYRPAMPLNVLSLLIA